MLAFFFCQRYGAAVPIVVFLSTLLAEVWADHAYGAGYYSSHLWVTGIAFLFSGVSLAALVVWIAPPSPHDNPATYGLLRDVELGRFYDDNDTAQAKLKNFVLQPSGTDHFCYFPLNWCALVLIVLGSGMILYDSLRSSS